MNDFHTKKSRYPDHHPQKFRCAKSKKKTFPLLVLLCIKFVSGNQLLGPSQRCKKQKLHAFSFIRFCMSGQSQFQILHQFDFEPISPRFPGSHVLSFKINLISNLLFPLDFLLLMISDSGFQTNTFPQISWFSRTRGSGHLSPRDFVSDFGQIDKFFRCSDKS